MCVLGRFLDDDVDHVVVRDDSDHAAVIVHDRHGKQVVLRDRLGDLVAIVRGAHGNNLFFHDVADQGVARRQDQVAQGQDARQSMPLVEDEDVVDRLAVRRLQT